MALVDLSSVESSMKGLGFEQVETLHECTYKESSTVIVCPTRGKIDYRVVEAWNDLIKIPNQRRSFLFCEGAEVGDAYNKLIQRILDDYNLSRYKYVMTVEDDNILPADAQLRLLDAIQSGPWDGVSGLYFGRREPSVPQVLGDPLTSDQFSVFDFKVRDVRNAMDNGYTLEVNAIPMGCAIFKLDLFREMPNPWFYTVNQYAIRDGKPFGRRSATHDLNFCEHARLKGKRFAVDCGLHVGHLDVATNRIF